MKPDPVGSHNERIKALGTTVTAVSLILLTYGVFRPAMEEGGEGFRSASPWYLIVGIGGIVAQQVILGWMKKGDDK